MLEALRERLGELDGFTFEAHAGSSYLDFGLVDGLVAADAEVVRPAEGLGLFEQQAFYASGRRQEPKPRPSQRRSDAAGGGKYAPLTQYLRGRSSDTLTVSFVEVAEIVGGLPGSARNHRAWWANDETHVQARSWLRAGWSVETVELGVGRVTFRQEG